ncbi:unnamed protein product [Alopecurus aequalis]
MAMPSSGAARLALVAGLIAFLMLAAQPATARHGAGGAADAGERSTPPPPSPPANAVASGTPAGARALRPFEFSSLRFSPVPPSAPSSTYDHDTLAGRRRPIRT